MKVSLCNLLKEGLRSHLVGGGLVTTNIGVIGLGKIGILHSGFLSAIPNCRLKVICEKESLIVKAAKEFPPKTLEH